MTNWQLQFEDAISPWQEVSGMQRSVKHIEDRMSVSS